MSVNTHGHTHTHAHTHIAPIMYGFPPNDNIHCLSRYHQYHHNVSGPLHPQHPLTQKAKFWGTYVSALKGNADLYAAPEPRVTTWYPSITETVPPTFPDIRYDMGKLESLMWRQRATSCPPTRVMPEANDRI